jgi:hypothetical protein
MTEKSKTEKIKVAREIKNQTIGYILTALGLVAGLAWNQAIQALVKKFFPSDSGSLLANFSYAVVITVIIVLVTLYLLKFQDKKEEEEKNEL